MRIVIIGNGVAGMEAALGVRRAQPDWKITIVSEESDHFFSRTALMWVMCGQMSHRDIEPYERDHYGRHGFERVRARATGIDVGNKAVLLGGGLDPIAYDKLLIATGSRPRKGPWAGSDLPGVGHFVTMQDLQWLEEEVHGGPAGGGVPSNPDAHLMTSDESSPYLLRKSARSITGRAPRNAAVVGGGLIGIEGVEVLAAAGLQPHFFIREEWFWPMALDRREANWIAARMGEHGVHVHLEHNVDAFVEKGGVLSGVKTDHGSFDADVAVVAIGVVPNTEWLGDSVDVLKGGAISVGENLQTSLPDVYAAGDCAGVRWANGARRPEQLWYTSREQGRVAAKNLIGTPTAYARKSIFNSAKLMDIEYTTVGEFPEGAHDFFYEERGDVRSTTRITSIDGRVVGINCLGRRWDHNVFLEFLREGRDADFVLKHLNDAAFDTEFVKPLVIETVKGAA